MLNIKNKITAIRKIRLCFFDNFEVICNKIKLEVNYVVLINVKLPTAYLIKCELTRKNIQLKIIL